MSGTFAVMSDQRENVYTELTALDREFGKGLSQDNARNDSTHSGHDQAVLKFLQRHSKDLTSRLPIGSMIQRMHSLGVITLDERASLERKRGVKRETDEAMAVGVLSLMESSTKSAEQRVAFLRVIEETRVDGLTKATLREIWTLLQRPQAHVPPGDDSSSVYQPLVSGFRSIPSIYQGLAPTEKDDLSGT